VGKRLDSAGPEIALPIVARKKELEMKVLSTEKSKMLAIQNGWSLEHAQGYVDGETFRRLGKTPPRYAVIGIDAYSLGFRAGYFERQNEEAVSAGKRRDLDKPADIATARVQTR
jgi:hypothetical protein